MRKSRKAYGQATQWYHELKNIDILCYTNLFGQFLYLIFLFQKKSFFFFFHSLFCLVDEPHTIIYNYCLGH
jgi:hypothetical protein